MEKLVVQKRKAIEQRPVVDPTKCYFCGGKVTAKCVTCRVPVCDDHLRETHRCELFSEPITPMCRECAAFICHW